MRSAFQAWRRWLSSLLFLPPLVLALLIHRYGVDLIDWDQWEIAALFDKAAHHSLSLGDLFAQQAEYRQVFPKVIFLVLGWLTHWNIKAEMFFSFLLACLVAWNIYQLGVQTACGHRSRLLLSTLIATLLIFAPSQFESWLLGEQINYFMPIACLTTALRVSGSALSPRAKLMACVLLSTISTFSSANGIVCWVVIPPVLLASPRQMPERPWHLLVWTLAFILNVAVYLYDYHKPPYTPGLWEALRHPVDGFIFFCALLGAPVIATRQWLAVTVGVGAFLVALFLAACAYVSQIARDGGRAKRLGCWVSLGAYSGISAIIVTIARVGNGLDQAATSRYQTFTVYLAVSLCFLAPRVLDDLRRHRRFSRLTASLRQVAPLAIALLILLHFISSVAGVRQMASMRIRRLQAKACLLFVNTVPGECLNEGFPDLELLKVRINAINALGYLRPSLITSTRVAALAAPADVDAGSYGRLETVSETDGGAVVASGWASLPERGEPADCILLTYETAQDPPVIFALAQIAVGRPSWSPPFIGTDPSRWRWQKSIPMNMVSVTSEARIRAWAFDATTGKAYRLSGAYLVDNRGRTVRPDEMEGLH